MTNIFVLATFVAWAFDEVLSEFFNQGKFKQHHLQIISWSLCGLRGFYPHSCPHPQTAVF